MPRRNIPLQSFNAVGAGQTATVPLSTNLRYHQIYIQYKTNASQATIETDIEEIRIKVDGKVQRRFSAVELNKINAFNGYAFETGMLPIFFSEPWRRSPEGEDALAWGTANVGTFDIEIDIASGATAPKLTGFAVVDDVEAPMVDIVKWYKRTIPVSATGIHTESNLPKNVDEVYQRLHCFETAASDISGVDITLESLEAYNLTDRQNSALLKNRGFNPQADVFHVVFDHTQRVSDGYPMMKGDGRQVREFRLDFDMDQAQPFTLLTEVRGTPD